ncbi:MAG: SDR family NAD(P)-dependent oxidoreductase [Myxococcales bacterium]
MSISGRVCLVTGGGRGIGRAIALALAREGGRVAIGGRSAETLNATAKELGEGALAVPLDVGSEESVRAAFAEVQRRLGPVEVLVNNAGIATTAPVHKATLADWQKTLEVNLTGTFLCMREALPAMLERRYGRILNVASTAAKAGFRYTAAYCASKHGVLGLTRSAAMETATKGITVNALCPGWTETDMLTQATQNISRVTGMADEQAKQTLAKMNPMGRIIAPEEVAALAVFLCREEAAGITGQAWSVDGGEVML